MKVKELKKILETADENIEVYAEILINNDDIVIDLDITGADNLNHCVIIDVEPMVLRGTH